MSYRIALAAALLLPALAVAGDLDEAVDAAASQAIQYRHDIHSHPELSNRETRTSKLVADHLRNLGLEVHTGIAHTGVLGILKGGRPGPTVAIRADMDALPVKEQSGLPFASTVTSTYQGNTVPVDHACGHDIHTSVQMGVATVLAGMRDELPGTVLFVFQPAEEGAPEGEEGGAKLMLKENVFQGHEPDAMFALHSEPDLQVGQVGWLEKAAFASSDSYVVTIKGKQAHGAHPEESIDPIVTAAQAVLGLQTIVSRNINPTQPAVLTVGIIDGGQRMNIIPSEVRLEGTVRTYDQGVRDQIERRMHEVLDGITMSAGAEYSMLYNPYAPPTINDTGLSHWARPVLEEAVGKDNVITREPEMGAEDFAHFAQRYPGFYFRLGVEDPEHPSGDVHTPTFRGDDGAIPVGIKAMSSLVIHYLKDHADG